MIVRPISPTVATWVAIWLAAATARAAEVRVELVTDDDPPKLMSDMSVKLVWLARVGETAERVQEQTRRHGRYAGDPPSETNEFTDEHGQCVFRRLDGGTYEVFPPQDLSPPPWPIIGGKWRDYTPPTTRQMTPGRDEVTTVRFVYKLGIKIVGRVVTETGNSVQGAFVGDRTNQEGRFELPGRPAGREFRGGITPPDGKSQCHYLTLFHIPAERMRRGQTVDIGEVRLHPLSGEDNLELHLYDVAGRIWPDDSFGVVLYGIDVPYGGTNSRHSGVMRLELPPGRYGIYPILSEVADRTPDKALALTEIKVGALTRLDVRMPSPATSAPTSVPATRPAEGK